MNVWLCLPAVRAGLLNPVQSGANGDGWAIKSLASFRVKVVSDASMR